MPHLPKLPGPEPEDRTSGGDRARVIPLDRRARETRGEQPDRPDDEVADEVAGTDEVADHNAGGVNVVGAFAETLREAAGELVSGLGEEFLGPQWRRKLTAGLGFLQRRVTGSYEVDTFGFDPELTEEVLLPIVRPLFRDWFRTQVKGIENIPDDGGALIVANHSGTLPLDGLMVQVAVHDVHPRSRFLRLLAADLAFKTPFSAELARKSGATLASAEDADQLLCGGEIVGVFPEGFKGIGKPFSERYKLQRFGRGGFVSSALRAGVPIIPCSIVGAEETYPLLGNLSPLARLLGLPYIPITPTFPWLGPLGLIPLPSKWMIAFGEPIPTGDFGPDAADDPMLVFDLTDQVRETIQHTLYELLLERGSAF